MSLDEKTGKIVPAKIKGLLDMGVKPVFRLTTEDGRTIRTTGNHPFLAKAKNNQFPITNFQINTNGQNSNSETTHSLFASFGNQNNNSESDSQQSAENVEISHNIIDIHSYFIYFIANKLNPQKNIDKIKPVKIIGKLIDAVTSGPTNIEAKNTCPISRQISETVSNLEESKSATICNQYNNGERGVNPHTKFGAGVKWGKTTLGNVVPRSDSEGSHFNAEDLQKAQWTKVIHLNVGDEIAVAKEISEIVPQTHSAAEGEGGGATSEISESDVKYVKIAKIELLPAEQVYDIEVEGTHNFVANGIIAHNTYISGNVGIGTTSPATLLSVAGDGYLTGGLGVGLVNTTAGTIQTSGNIISGGLLTINGTGTSTIANNLNVQGALQVGTGSTYINTSSISFSTSGAINTGTGGLTLTPSAGQNLNLTLSGAGVLAITNTATSTFLGPLAVMTDKFVVQQGSGNVGIGTTNPLQKLHVEGQCVTGDSLLPIVTEEKSFSPQMRGDVLSGQRGVEI